MYGHFVWTILLIGTRISTIRSLIIQIFYSFALGNKWNSRAPNLPSRNYITSRNIKSRSTNFRVYGKLYKRFRTCSIYILRRSKLRKNHYWSWTNLNKRPRRLSKSFTFIRRLRKWAIRRIKTVSKRSRFLCRKWIKRRRRSNTNIIWSLNWTY